MDLFVGQFQLKRELFFDVHAGRQGRHVQLQVQSQVQVQGQDTSEVQVSERCAETIRDFKTSGASLVKGRQMMRACKAMMRVPKQ